MFLCFVRRTDPLLVCHVFFYLCGGVTMTQTEEHVYVFCEPYWPPACLSCVLLFAWWCHNDANRGACVCVLCAILTPCLFVMCSSICVVVSPRHKQRSWWQTSRGSSLAQKAQMFLNECIWMCTVSLACVHSIIAENCHHDTNRGADDRQAEGQVWHRTWKCFYMDVWLCTVSLACVHPMIVENCHHDTNRGADDRQAGGQVWHRKHKRF